MASIRYTNDHEWIRLDGDVGTVGISDYAQTQLGDVVYVELPRSEKRSPRGMRRPSSDRSRRRARSTLPSPARSSPSTLTSKAPATVNEDAEGRGWFLKLKVADVAAVEDTDGREQYKAFLETIQ